MAQVWPAGAPKCPRTAINSMNNDRLVRYRIYAYRSGPPSGTSGTRQYIYIYICAACSIYTRRTPRGFAGTGRRVFATRARRDVRRKARREIRRHTIEKLNVCNPTWAAVDSRGGRRGEVKEIISTSAAFECINVHLHCLKAIYNRIGVRFLNVYIISRNTRLVVQNDFQANTHLQSPILLQKL